jgi:hypothetical protein
MQTSIPFDDRVSAASVAREMRNVEQRVREPQVRAVTSIAIALVPFALAFLGAGIAMVGTGFEGWEVAVGWLAAMVVVLAGPTLLEVDRPMRVFLDIVALIATLTVFAPIGGWWFAPAMAAQLLLDGTRARGQADLVDVL